MNFPNYTYTNLVDLNNTLTNFSSDLKKKLHQNETLEPNLDSIKELIQKGAKAWIIDSQFSHPEI